MIGVVRLGRWRVEPGNKWEPLKVDTVTYMLNLSFDNAAYRPGPCRWAEASKVSVFMVELLITIFILLFWCKNCSGGNIDCRVFSSLISGWRVKEVSVCWVEGRREAGGLGGSGQYMRNPGMK